MSEEHGSPRAEPGIGRRLEQARETRGLSLRRVEEITKIRARYLQELERGNFDVLPAVYVLGSLKTYADFLGLDGTALSRELKESLEPDEPEAAVAADPGETDDEYEAAPAASIGFDHLFVGMGVAIVSVLALMTLVSALARYEEPKVSQMNEPSVQDVPPEMALTGNVDPEPSDPEPQARAAGGTGEGKEQTKPDQEDEPEPPKKVEGSEENQRPEETSLFGDVEFVPMSPSSSQDAASASTSASAPASAAFASAASAAAPVSSTPPASVPPASAPSASAPPALTSPYPAPAASASATPDPPPPDTTSSPVAASSPAATDRPGDAPASPAPASARPARPAVASADTGSGPVAGPTRGGATSPGPGSVSSPSPGDAADAGRIQAGVDTTLETAIPGR